MAIVVAACGSDDAAPAPAAPAPAAPAPAAPAPAPAPVPEVDSVVYSGVTPNAGNWAIQIGVAEGIFEKNGLPTEMIFSDSSPAALAALIGGSIQFTSVVYGSAILANDKEPDVIMTAEGYRFFPFDLIVGKDIKSFEDLRGKTCGANNPPGIGDALYMELMIEHGCFDESLPHWEG